MDARLSDDGPLKGDTFDFIGFRTVSACDGEPRFRGSDGLLLQLT